MMSWCCFVVSLPTATTAASPASLRPSFSGPDAAARRSLLRRDRGVNADRRRLGLHSYRSHQGAVLAAVIIGVISAPIMFVMMRMAADPKIMGELVVGPRLKALGWLVTAAMAVAVAIMLAQMLF